VGSDIAAIPNLAILGILWILGILAYARISRLQCGYVAPFRVAVGVLCCWFGVFVLVCV
jgi:hypothetical protein